MISLSWLTTNGTVPLFLNEGNIEAIFREEGETKIRMVSGDVWPVQETMSEVREIIWKESFAR